MGIKQPCRPGVEANKERVAAHHHLAEAVMQQMHSSGGTQKFDVLLVGVKAPGGVAEAH
ncbi:MAG TPA: hypothetical protein VJL58_05450 [Pyrinomonadaceae bacterium]|nr:hypothetical protein [Pyrinomonadaceae bacterium]